MLDTVPPGLEDVLRRDAIVMTGESAAVAALSYWRKK
jgi:hypothetical protein